MKSEIVFAPLRRYPLLKGTEYTLITLIMGLMGAFFWAIRSPSGYGGSQSGLLAGPGWAVLCHIFANRHQDADLRPDAAPRTVAAIIRGITIGGLNVGISLLLLVFVESSADNRRKANPDITT